MPKVSPAHLEQRRQQILDAAIACFARRGFHQTTMADIAAEAGVSDTLAYRYFGGKSDLLEAAVRRQGGLTVDEVLGGEDGAEDLHALVDMLVSTNIRRFDDPQSVRGTMQLRFTSWAEALHDDEIHEGVLSRWRHHLDVAEGLVRRAQERDQVDARLDPRATARVMLAIHDGLTLQAVLDPDVDLDACREAMLAMIFDHPRAPDRSNPEGNG